MSEQRLFVRVRGRVIGPFSLAQLKALRERGQFHRFHEVSEDRRLWASAATLEDLFPPEGESAGAPSAAARGGEAVADPAVEWYYVDAKGEQAGPVAEAQLLTFHEKGTVTGATLVWKEGMAGWTALAESGLLRSQPGRPQAVPGSGSGKAPPRAALSAAFHGFFTDPVGGLAPLCEALGNTGALALGLVFCVFFDIFLVVAIILSGWLDGFNRLPPNFGQGEFWGRPAPAASPHILLLWVVALAGVLLVASLAGAIALVRLVISGKGCLGFDVLIASSYWLPLGLFLPIFGLLGLGNMEVIFFLYIFASSLQLLILNSGFVRVVGLSDRGALLAIPVSLALTIWLCKIVVSAGISKLIG